MRSFRLVRSILRPSAALLVAGRRGIHSINLLASVNNKTTAFINGFAKNSMLSMNACRLYSSGHMSVAETEEKVMGVLRNFDKVDTSKLSIETPFTKLGLDSLDVVEVMIALEDAFHIEIPDAVADKVQTPKEVAEYIYGFVNPHKPQAPDVYSEEEEKH